ncbi:MAG: hypothetical protein ACTSYD_11280, partial [Candidatus Heimdallarchaeaceae archaeon]
RIQRVEVLAHLYLFRSISLQQFSATYEIPIEELKKYIQMLIQESILRGFYKGGQFVVANFYKYPLINSHTLREQEIIMLGLVSYKPSIGISEIANITQLTTDDIIDLLKMLIKKGLIIGEIKKSIFNTIWTWKPETKREITEEDKVIVGTCMMLRKANIEDVVRILEIPRESILFNLMQLILHRQLELDIKYSASWVRGASVEIYIKRFYVKPKKYPLNSLKQPSRSIVGALLLLRKAKLSQIAYYVSITENEVIKELAILTSEGTFQTIFVNKKFIQPLEIPDIKPTRPIEETAALSFFNYQALIGILSTQHRIAIRTLSSKLNRDSDEVIDAIINLILEGFVKCTLKNKTVFIEKIYRYSKAQEGSLERWEKIVLGMVIAKTIITTKDIQKALGIKKILASEQLFSFYGKGLIKGSIIGNKLIPEEIPLFPPLNQLDDFPIHFQEIFGYAISNRLVKVKFIQNLWKKSEVAAKNIIYELTGSGLLTVEERGKTFIVQNHQQFLPTRTLNELGKPYIQLINEIEKRRNKRIKLRKLSEKLDTPTINIFKMICQLLGHGYYRGSITPKHFYVIGNLVVPAKKDICIFCGHNLVSVHQACPNCNAMPPHCTVCQGVIKAREEVYECPNCGNLTHKDHMEQWLKIKQECPICKTQLSATTLVLKRV